MVCEFGPLGPVPNVAPSLPGVPCSSGSCDCEVGVSPRPGAHFSYQALETPFVGLPGVLINPTCSSASSLGDSRLQSVIASQVDAQVQNGDDLGRPCDQPGAKVIPSGSPAPAGYLKPPCRSPSREPGIVVPPPKSSGEFRVVGKIRRNPTSPPNPSNPLETPEVEVPPFEGPARKDISTANTFSIFQEPSPDDPISSEDNIPMGHQSVVNTMPPSNDPGLIPPCEYLSAVSLKGHRGQKTLDKNLPVSKSKVSCIGSESSVDEDPARVSGDLGPHKDLGLMATDSLSPSISDTALLTNLNTQLSPIPISKVNDSSHSDLKSKSRSREKHKNSRGLKKTSPLPSFPNE
ncbi:hypothetical protein Nepgr_003855 [Nepenthes gracilis]|uniref:Uncharacterized protein n=1 Tax=Nepenthes gracilis TaxID=150966 RepID=A0AAD3S0F6_NEPGR|nr:hypothetical protein Nepgr_003855 [Nepenthes gracilis]